MLKKDIKKILLNSSVATICTALFKKGFRNQFVQGVTPLNKKLKNMVGFAYTVRYIPAREDLNSINVFENPNHPQPITPQRLISQRDDQCRGSYTRPTIFTQEDLLAYGANRWRRVEALAAEFAKYWKHYMYQIGDTLENGPNPKTMQELET